MPTDVISATAINPGPGWGGNFMQPNFPENRVVIPDRPAFPPWPQDLVVMPPSSYAPGSGVFSGISVGPAWVGNYIQPGRI